MNEPKRRGRPTGPSQNGDKDYWPEKTRAQLYAERVWAGQSTEELRSWRLERVRLALEGQGLSMEGVVL